MEKQRNSNESTQSKRQKLTSSHAKSSKASSSTRNKEELDRSNNVSELLIDCEKKITIMPSLSIEVNSKHSSAGDSLIECQKFIAIPSNDENVQVLNEQVCCTSVSLQQQSKELISMSPRPDNTFHRAALLQKDTEETLPETENQFEEKSILVDAFNCCIAGMKQFLRNKTFSEGFKWENLSKALTPIGVKSCMGGLEIKRDEKKQMDTREKKDFQKQQRIEKQKSTAISSAANENETLDNCRNENNSKETINLEGETVNPDEELRKGSAASRSENTTIRAPVRNIRLI